MIKMKKKTKHGAKSFTEQVGFQTSAERRQGICFLDCLRWLPGIPELGSRAGKKTLKPNWFLACLLSHAQHAQIHCVSQRFNFHLSVEEPQQLAAWMRIDNAKQQQSDQKRQLSPLPVEKEEEKQALTHGLGKARSTQEFLHAQFDSQCAFQHGHFRA